MPPQFTRPWRAQNRRPPLQHQRAFVFGEHALHLKQHLLLGAVSEGMVEEHDLAADPLELVDHQHLVGKVAGQAVGGANQHCRAGPLGDEITQPVEPRSGEGGAGTALVATDQVGRQVPATLFGGSPQGIDLAVDRLLLVLTVGRHAGISRNQRQRTRCRFAAGICAVVTSLWSGTFDGYD